MIERFFYLDVPNLRFPGFESKWKTRKLGEIADKVNSGKTPLGGETVYTKEGVLFIRSQNVNNDRLELDNSVFIPEFVNNQMKNSIVGSNDILLNITGASLGRSCVVPEDFKMGNVNQHVCIIRLKENYNPRFVQPIFSSYKGQTIFINLQTGSGREGLNFESIKGIKLSIPQKDEQQKIASFLCLIDERISTQNKIIEQLETLIKGLSEKLFSQKIRFKGFTDKWELKNLGEICEFHKGNPLSKSSIIKDGNFKCIHYGELFTTYKAVISDIASLTNNDGFKSKIGDILMPSSDVTPLGLATASVLLEDNVVLGGDINILRPRSSINPIFLSYLLNTEKKKIIELVSGTTVKHIYNKDLKKIKLYVPYVEEQIKIAKLLSSIDTKIEAETNLLDKYQSQKQYLLKDLFI